MSLPDCFSPAAPLELLAPARDVEVARVAIDHGADAVYIGGPGFGARAAAGNSLSDIAGLCSYAHRYHARVYMTLNTLLFDNELEAAHKLAWDAYDAGVDALIIQDMGLLQLDMPPIELHASTQCDIRTPDKAAFLDSCGFAQIVLARELTLDEVHACRSAVPRSRLEFFVHGALCVSYSGQCYLSCAQCARSANRGECAQPCRLPYTVYDMNGSVVARDKHVLSLKDNDQSDNLEALVYAGVTSFKIEGRLKNADYVKNITAFYRQRLDALIEKHGADGWQRASLGRSQFTFVPNPAKTFHRGATDYFLNGRQEMIAQLDTPKSTGEYVGDVTSLHRQHPSYIEVKQHCPIANGDGLVYLSYDETLVGLNVNRVESLNSQLARIYLRESLSRHPGLAVGTRLNRNKDRLFEKELEGVTAQRLVDVALSLNVYPDHLELEASSAGTTVSIRRQFSSAPAKNADQALQGLKAQLSKTGGTMFNCIRVEISSKGGPSIPFIPTSVSNSLRRDVLMQLETCLEQSHTRGPGLEPHHDSLKNVQQFDWRGNVSNRLARAFWLAHGVIHADQALECMNPNQAKAVRELMRCRHCIRHTLGLCPKMTKGDPAKKEAFKKHNGGHLKPEPLTLVNSKGQKLIARFDCKACEMTISMV